MGVPDGAVGYLAFELGRFDILRSRQVRWNFWNRIRFHSSSCALEHAGEHLGGRVSFTCVRGAFRSRCSEGCGTGCGRRQGRGVETCGSWAGGIGFGRSGWIW